VLERCLRRQATHKQLEDALQLSSEQQEMLIKILQNRHHENRRATIATDAQQTLADFHARILF
jgi:capsular polysaccharide biosynthesis protein